MKILRTVADVRTALAPFRARTTIGLVPTMGAFHDGHVALFRAATGECERVAVSLFVNPTQFGDARDLRAYPRDEARDAAIAEAAGIDWLFAPDASEMFAPDHATWVEVGGAAIDLEGAFRPGHFRGVATVCVKLFNIVRPDRAYFGQKDAQQVAVLRQLVRELNLDLVLRVVPTVRDQDGLAMSSRNARLSPEERVRALAIPRALEAGKAAYRRGDDPVAAARPLLTDVELEYVVVAEFDQQPTLAIAARVGATRLIDNLPLSEP
jgi:pantoate--beta-alanine ligase